MLARMGRPSLRDVFVAAVVLAGGWQLVAVTSAALPPNRYSEATEPMTGYLTPYFTQNWRLFAPNPVAEDRSMRFQASYRDESGEIEQTKWIDWTAVELDLVHHRVVGNRGGYVTSKLIEALSSAWRPLDGSQRNVLLDGSDTAPPSWGDLADQLEAAGAAAGTTRSVLRYESAAARLATDVIAARFPDLDVVAVRYSVQLVPVPRYELRDIDQPITRTPRERLSGWRKPVEGSPAERRVVADFDERHR